MAINDDREWRAFLEANPSGSVSQALTDARVFSSAIADGCIAMGGKLGLIDVPSDQYQGDMPGVIEEALLFLEANKTYVPLGAFCGGATRDIAIALGLLLEADLTPRGKQAEGYGGAIERVKATTSSIPSELRSLLEVVAHEENAEEAAQLALQLIQEGASIRLRKSGSQGI